MEVVYQRFLRNCLLRDIAKMDGKRGASFVGETMSAPHEAIGNGWRKIGPGVFSGYGRLLVEDKFSR